jgi:hypothetical protein
VEDRNKVFLDLIRTSSGALGPAATSVLASCAEHLMLLLTKGSNINQVIPLVTTASIAVKDSNAQDSKLVPKVAPSPNFTKAPRQYPGKPSTKIPLPDSLYTAMVQLRKSGRYVATINAHPIGINTASRAIEEKKATPEVIAKLWDIIKPESASSIFAKENIGDLDNNPALADVIYGERSYTRDLREA